jgi:ADP-heptose:LPS heptosyltransferase
LGRVLLTHAVQIPPGTHIVKKNLTLTAAALGVTADLEKLEFPIATTSEHAVEAEQIIASLSSERFAILNPGGGWVTKLWPAERFGELADRLWRDTGIASVLTTGPGEHLLANTAVAASKSGKLMAAGTSLKGFYELARRSALYVGGDTGPTHIAVAAGAPVVGLFGPTEWWRNGSPRAQDNCVERIDIGCRDNCHRRTCSKWICMDIDVDTVFAACRERLSRAGRPVRPELAVTHA